MATALSTWNWKNMTDGTSQLSINSDKIIRRNDDAGAGMVILVRKVGLTWILCRTVVGKSPGD